MASEHTEQLGTDEASIDRDRAQGAAVGTGVDLSACASAFERISCRISQTRPSTKPSANAVSKLASPNMAVSIKGSPICGKSSTCAVKGYRSVIR
jgi:hypothetical protein